MLICFFGSVAEWLCSGLQIRVRRFDSVPSLRFRGILMKEPCIVGVADAKINDRGCVEDNASVLTIQKICAEEALKSYIYWKSIYRKRAINMNEKMLAKKEYYNQKRNGVNDRTILAPLFERI